MMGPWLDERRRRLWAAAEARAIGRGGIRQVAEATGMSRSTVRAGLKELETGQPLPGESTGGRLRSPGGGRKRLTERDPRLAEALEGQLDPVTRGDPMGPLRWTCSSAARLGTARRRAPGQRAHGGLLHEMGYSLQGNRKTLEGDSIRTGTGSSTTSAGGSRPFSGKGSQSCRSTPRRRS